MELYMLYHFGDRLFRYDYCYLVIDKYLIDQHLFGKLNSFSNVVIGFKMNRHASYHLLRFDS